MRERYNPHPHHLAGLLPPRLPVREIMRMIDEGMTDEEIGAIYKPQMEKYINTAEVIAIYRKVHDGKLTPPEGTPFRRRARPSTGATRTGPAHLTPYARCPNKRTSSGTCSADIMTTTGTCKKPPALRTRTETGKGGPYA